MKIRVTSKERNSLLKRTEVAFEVEHGETGGTPSRFDMRKRLAEALKAKLELVYVKRVETRTGANTALGEANVYESVEQAKLVEPEHIVTRNAPPTEKPAEEPAEKPAEKPKEELKEAPKEETAEKEEAIEKVEEASE